MRNNYSRKNFLHYNCLSFGLWKCGESHMTCLARNIVKSVNIRFWKWYLASGLSSVIDNARPLLSWLFRLQTKSNHRWTILICSQVRYHWATYPPNIDLISRRIQSYREKNSRLQNRKCWMKKQCENLWRLPLYCKIPVQHYAILGIWWDGINKFVYIHEQFSRTVWTSGWTLT
jgi:hypothetical protein